MRFPQLKIGQRFEYQSKTYTKTGPLTASEEGTGASSMIRRSAKVMLLDGTGVTIEQEKQSYSREELAGLCRDYKLKLTEEFSQMAAKDDSLQLDKVLLCVEAILIIP
ncbi:MAG: polysulfide reductase chain A [Candidatus Thiodiazotropha sp. (ex Lucinoma borealis)]|nr:polysulfide reductase chain A [Candidatus Thiodiazotropha sp. (ex Lucinoma borealis)]